MVRELPVALTVAGSDSGGGAGIEADLKTFSRLGVFGTAAITCVTAQNPSEVRGIAAVAPRMVRLQMETVCDGFKIAAVKTGMLYSRAIVRAVAATVSARRLRPLVVDPVMVASSGARLLEADAVEALCRELLPKATVVTPNVPEAEVLCGHRVAGEAGQRRAAREIGERFGVACVVKGGHGRGPDAADYLYDHGRECRFVSKRRRGGSVHGTGCTFAAAIAAFLARGLPLAEAVREAKAFLDGLLARTARSGACRFMAV